MMMMMMMMVVAGELWVCPRHPGCKSRGVVSMKLSEEAKRRIGRAADIIEQYGDAVFIAWMSRNIEAYCAKHCAGHVSRIDRKPRKHGKYGK